MSLQSAQYIKRGKYEYLFVTVKVDTNMTNLYIFRKDKVSNSYQQISNITSGNVTAYDIYLYKNIALNLYAVVDTNWTSNSSVVTNLVNMQIDSND